MSAKTVNEEAAQTVSPRQWIRLVVVYLLIPLILFICGGDLGWWQAWLYSMLILAAGIGGRMWAEQRHPGLTSERQNIENIQNAKAWDKVLAPLMAVSIGFPLVIVAGLDHRYNWSSEENHFVDAAHPTLRLVDLQLQLGVHNAMRRPVAVGDSRLSLSR